MIKNRSILQESKEIQLAIELIAHGARLQLLEAETALSRDRLIRLYKEMWGASPPKGMLPFSVDWFLSWQPNIHASLFANIRQKLMCYARLEGIEATVKAYGLYHEYLPQSLGQEPVLSLTRAWTLTRFLNTGMLGVANCRVCCGRFVVRPQQHKFICGLCRVPSRAGKVRKAVESMHTTAADEQARPRVICETS
jgi:flagellar transcriptional activator FlhC